MKNTNQDSDGEAASGWSFQFTERHMELLRKGDFGAESEVVEQLFRYFDRLVRAVGLYTGGSLCREDCEDAVMDFFKDKFSHLIARYRFEEAKAFTGRFYRSLRNWSLDWLDKRMRRDGSAISIEEPIGEGTKKVEDTLPAWRDVVEGGLRPEEVSAFESEVRDYMLRWTNDPVKQWILSVCIFGGWTPKEASDGVFDKFSGKVYETGSVYSLLSRFRNDAGLGRIRKKYQ